ncbi:MAG TPA: SIS domain-containing protein [Candidatus Paceibacterota bacterium]|nr:SIS domain-containing protein [Candidatus Paceibacterota bacterium]
MEGDVEGRQLAYQPQVAGHVQPHAAVVVGGMGGSGLAGRAAQWLGVPHVLRHASYDLPPALPPHALYVAISYSGNTEETLSFAEAALAQHLPLAAITAGGRLSQMAVERQLPHVLVPGGMVPRDALIAQTKALVALLGASLDWDARDEPAHGAITTDSERLARALTGKVPLVYAGPGSEFLAYLWKTTLNETAKVPAFSNVFPEWNHNELQGIDPTGPLGQAIPVAPVILESEQDDSRIRHRMEAFARVFVEHGGAEPLVIPPPVAPRAGTFIYHWALARAVAHALAARYHADPDATPLIEAFKKEL